MRMIRCVVFCILCCCGTSVSADITQRHNPPLQDLYPDPNNPYGCIMRGSVEPDDTQKEEKFLGIIIPWVSKANALTLRGEIITYAIESVAKEYPGFAVKAISCGFKNDKGTWFTAVLVH